MIVVYMKSEGGKTYEYWTGSQRWLPKKVEIALTGISVLTKILKTWQWNFFLVIIHYLEIQQDDHNT